MNRVRTGSGFRRHPRGWLVQHAWSLAGSARRLRRRPLGNLMTVLVMGLALALPLVFWVLLSNAQRVAGVAAHQLSLNVFVQVDVKPDAVDALAKRLRAQALVAAVEVRTPAQGLKELASLQGFAEAMSSLDANPLPYVLIVTPAANADVRGLQALAHAVQGWAGVDQVQDNAAWQRRLQAMLELGRRAGWLLAVLLALAAMLVVGNGIRLEVEKHAEEIGVLQLIGASPAFIRRSYVYTGLAHGLAGGVLACLVTWLVEWALTGPVHALAVSYSSHWALAGLPLSRMVWVPVVAAGLGWLGARTACGYWLQRAG